MISVQRVQGRDSAGYTGYRVQRVSGTAVTYSSTSIEALTDRYFLQRAKNRKWENRDASDRLYPVYPFTRCPLYPFTGCRSSEAGCRA